MFIPTIPDNSSLKPLFEEIIDLACKLDGKRKFKFNKGASESELQKMEYAIQAKLPKEYRDFLRFSNGATLCSNTAWFYDIKYAIEINQVETSDDFSDDYFVIASMIGDGEALCFSKKTGSFISWFDGEEEKFDTLYEALDFYFDIIRDAADSY